LLERRVGGHCGRIDRKWSGTIVQRSVSPRVERRQADSGPASGSRQGGEGLLWSGPGARRTMSPIPREMWKKQVPPSECPDRGRRDAVRVRSTTIVVPPGKRGRPGAPGSASATPARLIGENGDGPRTPGCDRTHAVKKAFGPPPSLSSVVSRGFPMAGSGIRQRGDPPAHPLGDCGSRMRMQNFESISDLEFALWNLQSAIRNRSLVPADGRAIRGPVRRLIGSRASGSPGTPGESDHVNPDGIDAIA
jgi:hypothetical protein